VPVVVHLSDIHFGAHRPDLAESLLADIASVGPDLIVVSGDLTQRARRDQFEQARAFIDRLPAVLLTVVGNHDLSLINLPRRFLSETRRYERYITRDLDPIVTLPSLVAVGLDTMPAWRWKAGHVSSRQAAIVRDALGNAPPGAWRLVVTHHPVLPAHLSGLVGRDLLVSACAEAGVAILLSGHTHTPSVDVVDLDAPGIRRQALALVSGTAVSSRTRGTANAYEVVHLDGAMVAGGRITVRLREPISTGWSDRRTAHFGYASEGIVADWEPS
jgi:3',5'-cyclic AMP phosphodiesterase CpdA